MTARRIGGAPGDGMVLRPKKIVLRGGSVSDLPLQIGATDNGLCSVSNNLRVVRAGQTYIELAGTTYLQSFIAQQQFRYSGESTKTGAYTCNISDIVVPCDTAGGAFTVTLYAAPQAGQVIYIVDGGGNAGAAAITVDGNGNDILGSSSQAINSNYGALALWYNGSEWLSIG